MKKHINLINSAVELLLLSAIFTFIFLPYHVQDFLYPFLGVSNYSKYGVDTIVNGTLYGTVYSLLSFGSFVVGMIIGIIGLFQQRSKKNKMWWVLLLLMIILLMSLLYSWFYPILFPAPLPG